MVKELVKMDLKRMAVSIMMYSFAGIFFGGTGISNFIMFIFGVQGISLYLEERKNDKFLEVLPVSKGDILKSQIITSSIIIGIFLIVFILVFFLGKYEIEYIIQSIGVCIVIFGVTIVKFVEFNIEGNNIGIILKNIDTILVATIFIMIIFTEKAEEYVFNVFLTVSICALVCWFLRFGRKYYIEFKKMAKQYN